MSTRAEAHELHRASRMSPFIDWIDTSAENPYHRWFAVVLVALITTFVVWLSKRPTPRPTLRVIAAVAASTAVLVSLAHGRVEFDDWTGGYRMILKSTVVLTGCLVLELVLMRRRPDALTRAIARYRTARATTNTSTPVATKRATTIMSMPTAVRRATAIMSTRRATTIPSISMATRRATPIASIPRATRRATAIASIPMATAVRVPALRGEPGTQKASVDRLEAIRRFGR